jgi:prepilin-type N-terminal cleavage/methylation domain-containing protein
MCCVPRRLFNLEARLKRTVKSEEASRIVTTCRSAISGFTLTELMVVLGIMAILTLVALPAIESLIKAGGFTKAVYDMSDSLNLSRSYAMAQNTYVYVGLAEFDRTQDISVSPQIAGGLGRVAMASVATKDGTSDVTTWTGTSTDLVLLRQPQVFDFLHLSDNIPVAATGNMARPATPTNSLNYAANNASFSGATTFSVPLGGAAGGKYTFTSSIGYNSQGGLFLASKDPATGTITSVPSPQWVEIDLQPVSGNIPPPKIGDANVGNQAALLIDGVTGAATVYRP